MDWKKIEFNGFFMRLLAIGFLIVWTFCGVQAQGTTKRVTGNVVDEEEYPLVGVSVVVKGTSIHTYTDIDGNYLLTVPSDSTYLEISFIGCVTEQVKITDKMKRIVLKADREIIEDIPLLPYISYTKKIAGQVIDKKGKPISGASVYVKSNGSKITFTDENGNFELNVYDKLYISATGFMEKEVSISELQHPVILEKEKTKKEKSQSGKRKQSQTNETGL